MVSYYATLSGQCSSDDLLASPPPYQVTSCSSSGRHRDLYSDSTCSPASYQGNETYPGYEVCSYDDELMLYRTTMCSSPETTLTEITSGFVVTRSYNSLDSCPELELLTEGGAAY